MQYLCVTKSRADGVKTDDIGIMRGKMFERSSSYTLKSSKAEASNGVERNLLACAEAIGEKGSVLEMNILLATVMEKSDSKCPGLHEKSGWKALGQGLREGSKRENGREKVWPLFPNTRGTGKEEKWIISVRECLSSGGHNKHHRLGWGCG